jgi:hypothetical protein
VGEWNNRDSMRTVDACGTKIARTSASFRPSE